MSTNIGSMLISYLEEITDKALREVQPQYMPVVGLPSTLLNLLHIEKGMFIFEAYTGGGKTTFGRALFHMSRIGNIPFNVTYIDVAQLRRDESIEDSATLMERIVDIMLKPKSFSTKGYVMTTENKDFVGAERQPFEKSLNNIRGRHVVVIDELEKTVESAIASKYIPSWALALRLHYNRTGEIPLKIIVLLSKVIPYTERLTTAIARLGRDVEVFVEARSLELDFAVLRDYLEKLNKHFKLRGLNKELIGELIDTKSCEDLAKLLANIENGRYIFPHLRRAIADSIVKLLSNVNLTISVNTINDVIKALNSVNAKISPNIKDYIGYEIIAIAKDRYYGIGYGRRDAIKCWSEGLEELCRKVSEDPKYDPPFLSRELNYVICQVSPRISLDTFLWLSLADVIREVAYDKVIGKVLKALGAPRQPVRGAARREGPRRVFKILLLARKQSYPFVIESRVIGGAEFKFKVYGLSKDEILALLGITKRYFYIDPEVSEYIIDDLARNIGALLRSWA